jgi:hypothetical protein
MPSFAKLFPRPRVGYEPLDNTTFEMADHTTVPTNASEEGRDLDIQEREQDSKNHTSENGKDSSSTLSQVPSEPDDVTEEELATLRRVSDKIPLSAWCDIPLQVSR